MAKKIYYRYNAETDSYERIFPSFSSRMASMGRYVFVGMCMAALVLSVVFYFFESPTEANLRAENSRLKSEYEMLSHRLETSLRVMDNIKERDDNFYRVMMQMDPLSRGQRLAGLDNESRYLKLNSMSHNELIVSLTRQLDLLDRQLYAQSVSFDKLKEMAERQEDKLHHIPSIFPLSPKTYTLASGYGYRLDPVLGSTRFHSGMDFAAREGTDVSATADGKVKFAGWKAGYGNCIEIDHGFNYMTRYGNLQSCDVTEGEDIKRGDNIGKVGSTGKSSGPHLHYEVRFKDEPQNPVNYYFMGVSPEDYERMISASENAGHIMD